MTGKKGLETQDWDKEKFMFIIPTTVLGNVHREDSTDVFGR